MEFFSVAQSVVIMGEDGGGGEERALKFFESRDG